MARKLHRDVWLSSEHTWAASALNIAIDDLRGRQLGVPVHQLYGGAVRDRVRAYGASTGYIEGRDPEETWPEETASHAERGFTATKYRVGKHAVKREVPILERIRADHPTMALMADGNGAYTIAQSIEMGRALGALDFVWLEEPLPQRGGYMSYEKVAAALDISLAGGEITQSRHAALELIARGGVDIIQPEPVIIGGIGESIFVGELARLHNIGCVPHTSGSIIGIAAALHAIATIPDQSTAPSTDTPFLEVGTDPNPWRDGLPIGESPGARRGRLCRDPDRARPGHRDRRGLPARERELHRAHPAVGPAGAGAAVSERRRARGCGRAPGGSPRGRRRRRCATSGRRPRPPAGT